MHTFLRGIANIMGAWVNLFDAPEPTSETLRDYLGYDATDDAEALRRDWEAVGADMRAVMEREGEE